MDITDQHPYVKASGELKSLLPILEKINVSCFSYLKNYFSGLQINLSTNPSWVYDYYARALYQSSRFEDTTWGSKQHYFLWSSQDGAQVTTHGRDFFNSDFGITLHKKNSTADEFYFFSGATQQVHMHEFFINHLDLLEHFIFFFKDKFSKAIKKLSTHREAIQKKSAAPKAATPETLCSNTKKFLQITKVQKLHLDNAQAEILLSTGQTDCLRALLQNKTIPEIAQAYGLSTRTVEAYCNDLKHKFHCHSKSELLTKTAFLRELL